MTRPPDQRVAALLPRRENGHPFGKLYVDMVARCRDTECVTLFSLLTLAGPNGARMSMEQWATVARMSRGTVREHWAHLEKDGLVTGVGGGRGRGKRRLRKPHYPEAQKAEKAPPTWEPPARDNGEAGAISKRRNEGHYRAEKWRNEGHLNSPDLAIIGDVSAAQSGDSISTSSTKEHLQGSGHGKCEQVDRWLCGCCCGCSARLNRDQVAADQTLCSECWWGDAREAG